MEIPIKVQVFIITNNYLIKNLFKLKAEGLIDTKLPHESIKQRLIYNGDGIIESRRIGMQYQ
jgi:hypothetical protein